jgi:hypothetical protein
LLIGRGRESFIPEGNSTHLLSIKFKENYKSTIMRKPLLLFLAAALLSSTSMAQQDPLQKKYASKISYETSYKHMEVFTSDEFAGRGTGEAGGRKTAEYIKNEFEKMGLKGPVNGSYYQAVPLASSVFEVTEFSLNKKALENGKDFYVTGSGPVTKINVSDFVFVGYGITEGAYDDFAGLDVTGKVVMVINEGEPMDAQGNSIITGTKNLSEWSTARNKRMQAIYAKNPKMVLAVSSTTEQMLSRMAGRLSRPRIGLQSAITNSSASAAPVVVNLTVAAADQLLAASKNSVSGLKTAISSSKKAQSKKLKGAVRATYGAKVTSFDDHNVLGYLEGTDKKDELIVVMGHYDHDGKMVDGTIFRGADDNASGTVGMMEVARAFATAAKDGNRPRRSMLFIGLCAEEKGLIGSKYYAANPIFPLANTVAALNMDMIGRIDDKHLKENHNYIHVMGADKLSSELHEINYNANANYTHMELDTTYNDPKDPQRLYYRSDHYSFAEKGVPSIFYFSGLHPHYHTPEDTLDKIDFEMMVKRARLVFHTAWELANREKRIVVDSNKP